MSRAVRRLTRLAIAGVLGGIIVSALTFTVAAIACGAYVALLAGVATMAVSVVPFVVVYVGNEGRS